MSAVVDEKMKYFSSYPDIEDGSITDMEYQFYKNYFSTTSKDTGRSSLERDYYADMLRESSGAISDLKKKFLETQTGFTGSVQDLQNLYYAGHNTAGTLDPSIASPMNLQFATDKTLDSRITFTRSSTGSYYDANGRLSYAAVDTARFDHDPSTLESKGLLIEEQRVNLLTYSEDFDVDSSRDATNYWQHTRVSISANATTAPDGTVTADKLVEDTSASNSHLLQRNLTATTVAHTFYVFAKAAERSTFNLVLSDGSTFYARKFDLLTGTSSAEDVAGVSPANTYSMQSIGSGWYLCSVTVTVLSASIIMQMRLNNGSDTYTGDGTSGIYIWGAQLEAGAFPTSYVPSAQTFTSRASTGTYYDSLGILNTANAGVARMNYNPADLTAPPKLLLEESRTNYILHSEDFSNVAWNNTNVTVTTNSVTAPDGNTTADTLTASAANATITQNVTTTAVDWNASFFLKRKTGTGAIDITMDGTTWVTQTITSDKWTRVNVTQTGIAGTSTPGIRIVTSGDAIYAWGAQAE